MSETASALTRQNGSLEGKQSSHGEIALSIVIPAYNEETRLPRTLTETLCWCSTRNLNFELIIADDGSEDQTLALGRAIEKIDERVRVLSCPHRGKGATVRSGILTANGRYILFMDADGATSLDEIPTLLAAVEGGTDVAIGSRVARHPGEIEVKTSLHRRIIGRIFALFVNLFAVKAISDTQCGFKMFRRDAARAIFSRQQIPGFAFDVEILFIARQLSLSIVEIPVNWVAQPGSKVNLLSDSIKMLRDILYVRWLHRKLQARPSTAESGRLRQSS